MHKSKRIISFALVIITVVSVFCASGIPASAESADVYYDAVGYNYSTGKSTPISNRVFNLAGKKTYVVEASLQYPVNMSSSEKTKVLNNLRFDITVIEADGTKSCYYGVKNGFSFKLQKNRTYKVYITSYFADYKTKSYAICGSAYAMSLKYKVKKK